jgi:hypothetical protein
MMEEGAKNKLILILIVLTAIFFVITLGSCNNYRMQKLAHNKEMVTRLDLEEKMAKFIQERGSLEQKLSSATQGLEEEKAVHQATKKVLLQEQLVNQSLKEELEKVTKLKEKLEDDLKEALTTAAVKPKPKK